MPEAKSSPEAGAESALKEASRAVSPAGLAAVVSNADRRAAAAAADKHGSAGAGMRDRKSRLTSKAGLEAAK